MKKITNYSICLFLALTTKLSFGQCDESKIDVIVNNTCQGESNGAILLENVSKMIPSGPGEMYSCYDGELVTGSVISVAPGELKRLQVAAWADITIDGGTLIVCGSVSISKLEIKNGGQLILNGGSLAIHTPFTIPSGCKLVNANGSVALYNEVNVVGTLFNYFGTMAHYSNLNVLADGNVYNNSTFLDATTNTYMPDNYDENAQTEEAELYHLEWVGYPEFTNKYHLDGVPKGMYTFRMSYGNCLVQKHVEVFEDDKVDFKIDIHDPHRGTCGGEVTLKDFNSTDDLRIQWAKNIEPIEVINTGNSTFQSNLCAGDYLVNVSANGKCGVQKLFDLVEGRTIEDLTPIEEDPTRSLLKSPAGTTGWNFGNVEEEDLNNIPEDEALKSEFTFDDLLLNFNGEVGDKYDGAFEPEHITGPNGEGEINITGNYNITIDGEGELIHNGTNYGICKRFVVTEDKDANFSTNIERMNPVSFDNDGLPAPPAMETISLEDALDITIKSYHWLSANQNFVLSYTEIEVLAEDIGETYIFLENHTTNSQEESFESIVNLNCAPNPSSSTTQVSYTLESDANVKLLFTNSIGTVNVIVVDQFQQKGEHSIPFNVSNYVAGAYDFKLIIDGQTAGTVFIKE